MEYWWEGSTSTAISPTSASDVVGQRNKIGGITFGVTLILCLLNCVTETTQVSEGHKYACGPQAAC